MKNNQLLNDGDLILVDAGAEFEGYASDITRTWPVNGKFSPAQLKIYNLVLDAQKQIIAKCVIGANLDQLQDLVHEIMRDGLSVIFGRRVGEVVFIH